MDWAPDELVLKETIDLFRSATNPSADVQRRVNAGVETLKQRTDGIRYLAIVFARCGGESIETRQLAGLLLKNLMTASFVPNPTSGSPSTPSMIEDNASLSYAKNLVIAVLKDPHPVLRSTAGTIITSYLHKVGCAKWPEALATLTTYVRDASTVDIALSALQTLKKVAEDELDCVQYDTSRDDFTLERSPKTQFISISVDHFLPLLFQMCSTPNIAASLKVESLEILEVYNERHVFAYGEFAAKYFDTYWDVVGRAAVNPTDSRTRLNVLKAMCTVMEYKSDAIIMNGRVILDLFTTSCADENYDVRLAALGFWPELLKDYTAHGLVETVLARLAPILVELTRYSAMDYTALDPSQLEDDNASIPDIDQTLAPRIHQTRGTGDDSDTEGEELNNRSAWGDLWTVRKAAALALDSLALTFRGLMLPHCLPQIERNLQDSTSWEIRESGVLALGAISKGCMQDLDKFVPNVLELLIQLSTDSKPLLRSISCWCLNRFSPWFCREEYAPNYLSPVVHAVR